MVLCFSLNKRTVFMIEPKQAGNLSKETLTLMQILFAHHISLTAQVMDAESPDLIVQTDSENRSWVREIIYDTSKQFARAEILVAPVNESEFFQGADMELSMLDFAFIDLFSVLPVSIRARLKLKRQKLAFVL